MGKESGVRDLEGLPGPRQGVGVRSLSVQRRGCKGVSTSDTVVTLELTKMKSPPP